MFKILIDKELTILFNDNGLEGVNSKNDLLGYLINDEGIKKVVESLPISRYYINTCKSGYKEITKQQALFIYDEVLKATAFITLKDEKVMQYRNILNQGFLSFCNYNEKNTDEKIIFNRNMLYRAFCKENGINNYEISDNLKIYQTLGIGKSKLLQYKDIGEHSINMFDEYLSRYDLGLNIKLTDEQLSLLNNKDAKKSK